jgi:hypothetical protein
MPAISAELRKLLIRTNLVVYPEDFVVVYLPAKIRAISGEWFRSTTTRFAVVIQEPKSVTMIIPRSKWLRMQNIFEKYELKSGAFKVIGFDVKLSLVAKGYMAAVGSVLIDAGIGGIPISSFKRDHILVAKADLPRAVRVLRTFLESFKKSK